MQRSWPSKARCAGLAHNHWNHRCDCRLSVAYFEIKLNLLTMPYWPKISPKDLQIWITYPIIYLLRWSYANSMNKNWYWGKKHSNLSKPAFGNLLHCRFHTLTAGSRFFWQLMSSVGSPKLPNTVTVSNLKTPSMLIANSQCFWQLMSSVGLA